MNLQTRVVGVYVQYKVLHDPLTLTEIIDCKEYSKYVSEYHM